MKIAAFPKCYLEDISEGRLGLFRWIEMAKDLGAEGLELYSGFLQSTDTAYLREVGSAIREAGFAMPMFCCSPDFTNPDAAAREHEFRRACERIRICRELGGPRSVCRVLSGQRYPQISVDVGLDWVIAALKRLIPIARDHEIILGLENHYKDGYWQYPEFAQRQEVFLRILDAIDERTFFGVQYDPSNALVAGDDPLQLLRQVAPRVVSMHASDRYLAPGVTLEELRQADGTLGYSPHLRHGVTGQGLNDYDAIFANLAEVGYDGWVSIEDGINGMDEMKASIDFLKAKRATYFATTP
jgi:sugar phosphate isomerase/epimerase